MIDLRSDTVTRPTPEMRRAMAEAEVGDDVFGEDPTVNALERETADVLGKEAALLTPSGTMANQIAIQLHTRPGDSVLCEETSHVFVHEAGAASALAGVQFDLIPVEAGLSDDAIAERVRPDGLHAAPTTLLVVENTHNRALGRALGRREMLRIADQGRAFGLRRHCDGARLWNAAAATGDAEASLVEGFDSVAVCFSKGLGAPVGSALAGTAEWIARARKIRKRLGGGMRQAGILAAAARYALRHHRSRLADDHRRAATLARGIDDIGRTGRPLSARISAPPTNMVYFRAEGDPERLVSALAAEGLLVLHVGGGWIRAVTHLDVDDADIDHALEILRRACRG